MRWWWAWQQGRTAHPMRTLGIAAAPEAGHRQKGMLKRSENIVHRLFTRQICRARPNSHIHQVRKLYENIVPSHTVYEVECPDHSFRKFTNDGQYLICFSRNHQDLIVYRHKWLSFCVKGEDCDQVSELPLKSRKFETYFTQLYSVPLASGSEVISKDFFLSTENGLYGIFATSTVLDNSAPSSDGPVPGVPCTEKIAIILVSLSDGLITDEQVYHNDFIHLAHNTGVFLYDDLLVILSIRHQCIRILQIRETGKFVDVRTIGAYCREDDELVLNSQSQEEELYVKEKASSRKAQGLPPHVEASAPGQTIDSQGSVGPPLWSLGMKHPHPPRSGHGSRNHMTQFPSAQVSSGHPGHWGGTNGFVETRPDGIYGGMHGADFDLQYDDYFGDLFASLGVATVGHTNDPLPADGRLTAVQGVATISMGNRDQVAGPSTSNDHLITQLRAHDGHDGLSVSNVHSAGPSVSGDHHFGTSVSHEGPSTSTSNGHRADPSGGNRNSAGPSMSNGCRFGPFVTNGHLAGPSMSNVPHIGPSIGSHHTQCCSGHHSYPAGGNSGRAGSSVCNGHHAGSSRGVRHHVNPSPSNDHQVGPSTSNGNYVGPSISNGHCSGSSPANSHHSSPSTSSGHLGVELGTTYAPLESAYGNPHVGRNPDVSTSGSGGHHSAVGPSRYARSHTSTSGDSLDRYTSGRGSPSVWYTSTTMTTSDSGSQSEGSRHDASVSGGSLGYGPGPGGSGSVTVHSPSGHVVEYVVSSRTHGAPSGVRNGYPEGLSYPSRFSPGINGRTLAHRDNGQSFDGNAGTSLSNGYSLEHRGMGGGAFSLSAAEEAVHPNNQSIPSQFSGDGSTDRTVYEIGSHAPVSHRNGNNRSRSRGTNSARTAVRSTQEGDNGRGGVPGRWDPNFSDEGGEKHQALGGIKQRLLSFIYREAWNHPVDKVLRLKNFYLHFRQYVDLVIWKVQFLDRYHLLIKFGHVDGVVQRNSDASHQSAFLVVYNLETTEILGFYQNSSEELLHSYEHFCDHFRVPPRYPLYMNFISSCSNNLHMREQLHRQRLACRSSKTGSHRQAVIKMLSWLPFNSQSQSPSVYFDQSLFHYDEKQISAMDRHKQCLEHPIKFISRRRPNSVKFKINPGPEFGTNDSRPKRVASFVFHPIFPFAISIQQSYMQPSIVNFHFRK